MKRLLFVGLLLIALSFVVGGAHTASAAGSHNYNVLVGVDDPGQGISIGAFYPATLHVHVGDHVNWMQNTHEIHTVTFLAGGAMPPFLLPAPQPNPANSPLMFNPVVAFPTVPANGQYDGSTYANSGIMSLDDGMPTSFGLTFTQVGTYDYLCLIHGMMMSGQIVVEDDSVSVKSPKAVSVEAKKAMVQKMAEARALIPQVAATVQPPTVNPDGTTTYHVLAGYDSGQIMLMRFFPQRLNVHPGDTVIWTTGDAPHTITFLNGGPDIPFAVFVPPPQGPMLLLNPAVLAPLNPGVPLTGTGVYSSGFFPAPGLNYSLTIGNVTGDEWYQCLLHDTSGMTGLLHVVPPETP